MKHSTLASAVITAASLVSGVLAALGIATLVQGLPFHASDQTLLLLVLIPLFGGGAIWGFLLARYHGLPNTKGASIAGSLSFGVGVIAAANLLGSLERVLVQGHRLPGVPIHVKFTLLFVPATFLVATIGASAILLVSGNRVRWFPSALVAGAAAAFRSSLSICCWMHLVFVWVLPTQSNAPPCLRSHSLAQRGQPFRARSHRAPDRSAAPPDPASSRGKPVVLRRRSPARCRRSDGPDLRQARGGPRHRSGTIEL